MSRTRGAKDLIRRHQRSDIGKKRKRYAGKKTKSRRKVNGQFVTYAPVSQRKTTIKLYIWAESKMSLEGLRKFPRKIRKHIRKMVYGKGGLRIRIDVSVYEINTKEKVENFCEENLFEGVWLIMGFSHARNKFHVSPRKIFKVRVRETPDGLNARMLRNYSGFRRWWWKGTLLP